MTDRRPDDASAAVTVRIATPAEYAAAGALVAAVYAAEGRADGPYLAVLRDAAGRAAVADLLVATDPAGRLLGTVTYAAGGSPLADIAAPGEAEFRMLAVAPETRGRGVGAALVRACVDRARAQAKRHLVMSTQPEMRTAHRLYERLGFARAPERDWSPEPGLNLRVYAIDLVGDGIGNDPR